MTNTVIFEEPPAALATIAALTVSREDLAKACDQARYASRRLHAIEALSELDWEEMNGLCRAIHQTEMLLQAMLEAGDEKKQAACKARAIAQTS